MRLGLVLCLVLGATPALAKKRKFDTGYVVAMTTCKPTDDMPFRIMITSAFFAYCPGEFSRDAIKSDKQHEISQVIKAKCNGEVTVNIVSVETWGSEDVAERNRAKRENDSNFKVKVRISGWGKYSSECE